MEQIIAGCVLFGLGGLMAVRPRWYLRFQIFVQKRVMGAEYVPSLRTERTVVLIGAALSVLGLLNITGLI
jgi:hypothetical protein